MYQKVISNIQHYYTFGDKYKESDTLKKVLQWSKEKLVETAMENK